ncbi:G patch domain and ankyrin repeat-containing protein 1 homolog [Sergentomyia squamirostris]
MHPNWRALATVDFPRKIFVKESINNSTIECKKVWEVSSAKSGKEAKEFYDEIIQDESKTPKAPKCIPERRAERKPRKKKAFNKGAYFRATTGNDIDSLKQMDFLDSVETRDEFGWTALMMAACEGASDTFTFLLEAGASANATDSYGNSVESLARKKGQRGILEILENWVFLHGNRGDRDADTVMVSPHFCETCRIEFRETSRAEHETSTLHKFNTKSSITFTQRFPVSNSNRGCRIMMKQGWNKQDGLGPSGSGNLFPIKTVRRRGRTGLGVPQDPPKITHFKPNDPAGVRKINSRRERSRKDILWDCAKEKSREKRFRQELS